MPIQTASRRSVAGALLAFLLVVVGFPLATNQIARAQEEVLYLSIVDDEGNPVTDITEDEIIVQWDGQDSETVEFAPVDWPVRVTVFLDNSNGALGAVQHMRTGLGGLLDALPSDVEVGLLTLARQPRWVVNYTSNRVELERGIGLIAPDTDLFGGGTTARFLDALIEEANRIDRDDERQYYAVIIMLSGDGVDGSSSQQNRLDEMADRLLQHSVEVHTLLFASGNGFGTSGLQGRLGDALARNTRGSFDFFSIATAFTTKLPELGRELARKHRLVRSQYRITYRPPQNPSDQPSLGVVTSRDGIDIFPTFDGNIPTRRPQR